jgi:hypothetical protein
VGGATETGRIAFLPALPAHFRRSPASARRDADPIFGARDERLLASRAVDSVFAPAASLAVPRSMSHRGSHALATQFRFTHYRTGLPVRARTDAAERPVTTRNPP